MYAATLFLTTNVHVSLQVTTNLTTEHVKGTVREGDGTRLDKQGYSRWVCWLNALRLPQTLASE